MVCDWSSLLDRLASRSSAARVVAGDEEEWCRRRAGAGREDGFAMVSASASGAVEGVHRFRRTGLSKQERGPDGQGGLTIAGILAQPGYRSDASIIGLFETVRRNGVEDEERRRRGGGGLHEAGLAALSRRERRAQGERPASDAVKRSTLDMASRAATAAGAQSVVIKVISTVSSRAAAAGLIHYLGTRELEEQGGERASIPILDGFGNAIVHAQDRAAVLADWVEGFREAYAVNSLVSLKLTLDREEAQDPAHIHDALNSAFGAMPFFYASDGRAIQIVGVLDINPKKLAEALLARREGAGATRLADRLEARFGSALEMAGVGGAVTISRVARNEQAGKYALKVFLEKYENVVSPNGDLLAKTDRPVQERIQSIWNEWRPQVKPVTPRNAFHVVFSARAGTDAEAMIRAVRDFLSDQIPTYRWMTAHHPETRHVHVHAMIAARDDLGKPLRFTKPELREWRETFAAKAREHGIAMVATRRSDLAATRPYTQVQAGAAERGRQDPDYLRIAAVRTRVERKQAGIVDPASLGDKRLGLYGKWAGAAQTLRQVGAPGSVIEAAERFSRAAGRDDPPDIVPKGYLLLNIALAAAGEKAAIEAAITAALRVQPNAIAVRGQSVIVLMPTAARISRIGREIGKQNDEIGSGRETQRIAHALEQHLHRQGIAGTVAIEAAGSMRDGKPTPRLVDRFRQKAREAKAGTEASNPLPMLRQFIRSLEKRKERKMAISLEQFDERVARANMSMDRLEGLVGSSVEQQAVAEMRQEIAALFAEQREQLTLQAASAVDMRSGGARQGTGGIRSGDRQPAPSRGANVDPAIAAQQAAIARARNERAARDQAAQAKKRQDEQRQHALREAEHKRQQQNEPDGPER